MMKRGFVLPAIVGMLTLMACHRETFEERVARDIERINERETPHRMDEATMLDSLRFDISRRTICYYYTLEGLADDAALLKGVVSQKQRELLLQALKGSIQLRPYKEKGLSFEYVYLSQRTGKRLMRFRFTEKDYR